MSFEGYFNKTCSVGHNEKQDVYMETKKCPCGEEWVFEELIDTTNGEDFVEYGISAESFDSIFNKDIDLDPDGTTINELNEKIDKLTTQLVSYEATIGHLKEALIEIADDRSPPWDKTDFQRIAQQSLKGIRK
jgi:hypothetical protein